MGMNGHLQTLVGCPPSSGDNVFFDSNSFTSSGQTVKIDIDNAAVNNMNWTGVVSDPTFNFNRKTWMYLVLLLLYDNQQPQYGFCGISIAKEEQYN